jgi:type VI secretion system Hcp family effector
MSWSQIFLDIEFKQAGPIKGESEFAGFEDQIVLLDFDWSMRLNKQQGGAAAKRRVTLADLTIKKRFDSASVKLLNCLNNRDPIVKARITVAHRIADASGGGDSMRRAFVLEVTKARLESISLDMTEDGKSTILQEDVEIRFTKVRIERYPLDESGKYSNKAMVYESEATDNLEMNEAR